MFEHRACGGGCCGCHASRRQFLGAVGTAAGAILAQPFFARLLEAAEDETGPVRMAGPGGRYVPRLKAAFVRRPEYGMWWPGAIYDGEAARRQYTDALHEAADRLGVSVDLRGEPLYSAEEADAWLAEADEDKPDGLVVLLLDRQEHAWPTVMKAIETGIPTVAFSPMGTSFIGQARSAARAGAFVCATDDFSDVAYGMKMLRARAVMRRMRLMVVHGNERREGEMPFYGTHLHHVPETIWREFYEETELTPAVRAAAEEYLGAALELSGPTEADVLNGLRCYVSARRLLEAEECDAVTMNCLGAVGQGMAFPCIAFSRMLDCGVPAICEADLNASISHMLLPLLFDRPGFQFNPVPVTDRNCLICSHCTCATRLKGFDEPSVPYHVSPHHADRDAVPVPHWEPESEVSVVWTPAGDPARMLICTGKVVEQVQVPPAGGCVVAPMVRLDGDFDVLDVPGHHQLLFYGNWRRELLAFCNLFGIEPILPEG